MSLQQPSIDILLATYQGGDHFTAQLDSLARQSYPAFNLIIRNDDCEECIAEKIEALSGHFAGQVTLLDDDCGQLGPLRSFSRLLEGARSDYMMLCDQDDVWLTTKVEKTLAMMLDMEQEYGKNIPLLVHTDLTVVNHDLKVTSESLWQHQNIHPKNREVFNRLLVQNVVSGCTVMINKALRDIALPIPDQAVMHDWWLALVASAFGKIGHVDQATMLYRQHNTNEIGAKEWGLPFILKNLFGNDGKLRESIARQQSQALAFIDFYQETLADDLRSVAECYATIDQYPYVKKICLLLQHRLFKAGLIRNIGLWAHI